MNPKVRLLRMKRTETVDGEECIVYPHGDTATPFNSESSLLSESTFNFTKEAFFLTEAGEDAGISGYVGEINDCVYAFNNKKLVSWPVGYWKRRNKD